MPLRSRSSPGNHRRVAKLPLHSTEPSTSFVSPRCFIRSQAHQAQEGSGVRTGNLSHKVFNLPLPGSLLPANFFLLCSTAGKTVGSGQALPVSYAERACAAGNLPASILGKQCRGAVTVTGLGEPQCGTASHELEMVPEALWVSRTWLQVLISTPFLR